MSPSRSSHAQVPLDKLATPKVSEDWLALIVGLSLFLVSLGGFGGVDVFGWVVKTNVWTEAVQSMTPVSRDFPRVKGIASLIFTYLLLLGTLMVAAKTALRVRFSKFVVGFTLVFFISYFCFAIGHFAYLAATPIELKKFGIPWSMNLTGEAGFIVALIAGLVVGNFLPSLASLMKDAVRPELYIKIAIVLLGATLGVKSAEAMGLAKAVMFRGLCAIVEAYLIYWALVYFIARKYFRFSREWAAPLASGISICGVSAAIATGGAIRARPIVPVLVSSLVVIFAVIEVLILPFLAQTFLWQEPLVAGAWIGLAVKTDGAAVAGGGITESLILAKSAAEGVTYQPGWILGTTATVKVFIDVFIGIWAFVLGYIWTNHINVTSDKAKIAEIWQRFPKFILGFVVTFVVGLYLALGTPADIASKVPAAIGEANTFRVIFFILTFFSIGVLSNFKKLWQEGIGKLAAVYVISLFGFVIWVGLLISWLFFSGIKPPLAS